MEGSDIFYHVFTAGLSKSLMFADDEDFIAGMNDIPACSLSAGVKVYCFCLMDNHVHFILKGSAGSCVSFIRQFKRLRSRRFGRRAGHSVSLDGAEIGIKAVEDAEYLVSVMAYVMRNPVAAGITVMPGEYPWSSASLYFGSKVFRQKMRKFSDIGSREKKMLPGSRLKYPDDYLLQEDGMIFPGSYVEYAEVEKMYRSPKRLLYYLSKNSDMEYEIGTGTISKTRYRDSELSASLDALSSEMFSVRSYSMLRIEDRFRLAKEVRRRYGASVLQVARVTGIEAAMLRALGI